MSKAVTAVMEVSAVLHLLTPSILPMDSGAGEVGVRHGRPRGFGCYFSAGHAVTPSFKTGVIDQDPPLDGAPR